MLLRAASNMRCDTPGETLVLLGEGNANEQLPERLKSVQNCEK